MDPLTIMALVGLGGKALEIGGGWFQGQDEADAAEAQARVARENAKLELERGAWESLATRRQATAQISEQMTGLRSQGQTLTGSNLAIVGKSRQNVEQDVGMIRREAALRAANFENQAKSLEAGARQARRSANILAGTKILSTAANAYTGWGS